MDCLICKGKFCKSINRDCNGKKNEAISEYKNPEITQKYLTADELVSNGRAGKLNRLEEIIEFARANNYKHIAIAYCYSIENIALEVRNILKKENFFIISVRCTINGIKEKEINENLSNSVSCNPIGQAKEINKSKAQFVIMMGLCMGHDVIFQQYLKKPFTTLLVKDRKYAHNTALSLKSYKDANTDFIINYTSKIKSMDWLLKTISTNKHWKILDFRKNPDLKTSKKLSNKVKISLLELTDQYQKIIPDKQTFIACLGDNNNYDSFASAMFLYSRGYKNIFII